MSRDGDLIYVDENGKAFDTSDSVFDPAYDLTASARELVNAGRYAEAADAFDVEGDAWEVAGRPDIGRIARRDAQRYREEAKLQSPPSSNEQGGKET